MGHVSWCYRNTTREGVKEKLGEEKDIDIKPVEEGRDQRKRSDRQGSRAALNMQCQPSFDPEDKRTESWEHCQSVTTAQQRERMYK
jgi:hypothetical protein